jgi:hypothetical protein
MSALKVVATAELAFCWLYVLAFADSVVHALITCSGVSFT